MRATLFSFMTKVGQSFWVLAAIIITEALISIKFLWEVVTLPPSRNVILFWSCLLVSVLAYACWLFVSKFLGVVKHSGVIETKEILSSEKYSDERKPLKRD